VLWLAVVLLLLAVLLELARALVPALSGVVAARRALAEAQRDLAGTRRVAEGLRGELDRRRSLRQSLTTRIGRIVLSRRRILSDRYQFVHVLGTGSAGRSWHTAEIQHDAAADSRSPIWSRRNTAVVAADGEISADIALQAAFPAEQGYRVGSVGQLRDPADVGLDPRALQSGGA